MATNQPLLFNQLVVPEIWGDMVPWHLRARVRKGVALSLKGMNHLGAKFNARRRERERVEKMVEVGASRREQKNTARKLEWQNRESGENKKKGSERG
jgi:hypothetical protein